MRNRGILLTFLCIILSYALSAQEFSFSYDGKELDDVLEPDEISKNILGDQVATKLQLLRESYTYMEYNSVTRTDTRVIEKSSIYNSIKKTLKTFEKGVKKGSISKELASQKAETMLDIALNIRYQNTEALETVLWKTKKAEDIADVFFNKVSIEGYVSKFDKTQDAVLTSSK